MTMQRELPSTSTTEGAVRWQRMLHGLECTLRVANGTIGSPEARLLESLLAAEKPSGSERARLSAVLLEALLVAPDSESRRALERAAHLVLDREPPDTPPASPAEHRPKRFAVDSTFVAHADMNEVEALVQWIDRNRELLERIPPDSRIKLYSTGDTGSYCEASTLALRLELEYVDMSGKRRTAHQSLGAWDSRLNIASKLDTTVAHCIKMIELCAYARTVV